MKNTFKKMAALLMAVAMVITSMSITAFAAPDADVTVKGVDSGKVTLYQIVKEGNGGWVRAEGVTAEDLPDANITSPTGTQIHALAAKTSSLKAKGDVKDANGDPLTWTGLEPGIYMAVVTETSKDDLYVYSPMILSVDYSQDDPNTNEVDAANSPKFSDVATAKKAKPEVVKEIVDYHDDAQLKANVKGDGTNKGDTVSYKVTATIPAYSKDYKDPEYFFSDTLGDSFEGYIAGSLKVTEAGKDDPKYHFVTGKEMSATGHSFQIEFDDVKVGEAARTVVIEYQAKISETAFKSGFDPNTNTAEIEYSHDPKTASNHTKQNDETHHYTFNIDAEFKGITGENEEKTSEIIKVDETGKRTTVETQKYISETKHEEGPLSGAKFELRKKSDDSVVGEATSDANGKLTFKGLDVGEYYLVETEAPSGYALLSGDDNKVPVVISAEIDSKGKLMSYSITVNGENTTTYRASYDGGTRTITRDTTSVSTLIRNLKVGNLPSTGGMGTVIFTIAGIAIMAIAAGLFIAKRKSSK